MTSTAFPKGGGLVLGPNEGYLSFAGMMAVARAETELQIRNLRSDIDRLCLHGIMRRGLVLDCETCGRVNFVPLDTVSHINSCVRCGAPNPLTVDRWRYPIAEPTLSYDLHAAARELLAEDSGVALLCSAYLQQSARSYADLIARPERLPRVATRGNASGLLTGHQDASNSGRRVTPHHPQQPTVCASRGVEDQQKQQP
jgi:hypothetical protein